MRWCAFAFVMFVSGPALASEALQPFTPAVLSADDVRYYREIIAQERAGHFSRAQALYDKLDDKSLRGYVEAEHMLSSHSGRTPEPQLTAWLKTYGDLPVAKEVYDLAVKRATRTVRRHHHRVKIVTTHVPEPTAPHIRGGGYEDVSAPDTPLDTPAARTAADQIKTAIRAAAPDEAYAVFQALYTANTADASDLARLSQRVCASYVAEGMDDKAFDLCNWAASGWRRYAPLLDWYTGLAAFRLRRYADAAPHFETVAHVSTEPNWTHSAAAFWAARSYMRAGDPTRVVQLLDMAAQAEPTFYGLLAERLLGEDPQTGFADPVLLASDFERIVQDPAGHRAVALWQVGGDEQNYVIPELSRAFGNAGKQHLEIAYAALARIVGHTNLELRASEISAAHGLLLTGLFPIPQYQPLGGYTIDPSLVLAFVRLESRFQPNVVSPVGAMGLMQVMPGTADLIGGSGASDRLFDPSYNMTLGQRYVARLLDLFNGNLIDLGAAYNAGPGHVTQWKNARAGKEDDPLMFIESIGWPATRAYVKLLLTYYWMYHRRNDRPAASLDEAARGDWPTYHPPQQSAPPPPPPGTDEENGNDDGFTVPSS